MTVTIDGANGVTTPLTTLVNAGTNVLMPALTAGVFNQRTPALSGTFVVSAVTFNLPLSSGVAGYVLTTDGAGNLSWTLPAFPLTVGSSQIAGGANNSLLYDNNGFLGELSMGAGVKAALGIGVNTALGIALLNNMGFLPIAQGGTGAGTSAAAANNLLPTQAGQSGKFLTTDGAGTLSWGVAGTGLEVGVTPIVGGSANSLLYDNGGLLDETPMGAGVAAALAIATNTANGLPTLDGSGALAIAQGGTGATTATDATTNLLPAQAGQSGKFLTTDGAGNLSWAGGNLGTVTSVAFSAGTTGFSVSGSPVTTSGTITLNGTLSIGAGGTGQTTANAALNALLPTQGGNPGKYLRTDGANANWVSIPLTGTVTSVDASGGTTGLTFTGGPITTSGVLTLGGTLGVANGGTGLTSVGGAGTVLGSNGSSLSYVAGNVTLGTTTVALGGTSLTLGGLTSVTVTQDPVSNLQLATKQYVDVAVESLNRCPPVAAATTLPITLSGPQTIDTVPVVAGDRVLVKDQASSADDGIYIVAAGPWTRAPDLNLPAEFTAAQVFVLAGSQANTSWIQTATVTTIGVSPQTWLQQAGLYTYNAGTGISIAGQIITNTGVLSLSGGTTGLTPNVATTGAVTLAGTLAIGSGGTGQTTANDALNALLPVQTGNNGKVLSTDGSNTSWATGASLTSLVVNSTPISGGATGALLYGDGTKLQNTTAMSVSGGVLTLGAQQTTAGALVLANTAAGAFSTTLQSSASAAEAQTYTLPVNYPAGNGYALVSTTGGVTSWATGSSLTSLVVNSTPTSGGAAGQIMFDDGTKLQESAGLVFDATNKTLTVGGGSVAISTPVLDLSQTWNDGGSLFAFTAIKLNITDTSSRSTSVFLEFQIGGSRKFAVTKAGSLRLYGSTSGDVTVRVPAAAGTGTVFQLPATNGTSGWVLQTDGSGNTSWVANGNGTVTSVDASGGTTGLTFSGGPITSSGTLTLGGTLGVANGGTGLTTLTTGYIPYGNGTSAFSSSAELLFNAGQLTLGANSGSLGALKLFGSTSGDVTVKAAAAAGTGTVFQLPATNGTNGWLLQTDGAGVTSWVANANGTVTSVDASGGTTGLTFSGGPITSSGTLTLGGTLGVANGGTGLVTLTAGRIPYGDGTNPLANSDELAYSAGQLTLGANSGSLGALKLFGSTSGDVTVKAAAAAGTATVFQLPATNGTSGWLLQTDGTGVTSWVSNATGIALTVNSTPISGGAAGRFLYDDGTKLQETAFLTYNTTTQRITADVTYSFGWTNLGIRSPDGSAFAVESAGNPLLTADGNASPMLMQILNRALQQLFAVTDRDDIVLNLMSGTAGTAFQVLSNGVTLQTGGKILPFRAVTRATTVLATDYTLSCSGTFTVTLPTMPFGQVFNIKNAGSGVITVSGTIDGQASWVVTTGDNMQVQSTGAGYIII